MGKLCVRCGYERQPGDNAPATECPRCGVIYARVEGGSASAHSNQARVVRANLRHRQAATGAADAVPFKTLFTPMLARGLFLAAVLLGLAGAAFALMSGQLLPAVASLAGILVVRIVLESTVIMFRIADDLAAMRTLLSEQALDEAREAAKARS